MKKIKLIALLGSMLVFIVSLKGSFSKRMTSNNTVRNVSVAAVDIPQQTIIKADMLKKIDVLETSLPEDGVEDLEELIGKVSLTDIYAKDIITLKKVSEPGSQKSGISYMIPSGQRAITIDVHASSGIAGLIRVGNHLDIINVVDEKSKMLLQNKTVLALDRKISDDQKESAADQNIYMTITLAVSPEEALALSLGDAIGVNRAILRNPDDTEVKSLPEVVK